MKERKKHPPVSEFLPPPPAANDHATPLPVTPPLTLRLSSGKATIYDAGCLALAAVPELRKISISTPNLHYLPTTNQLKALKEVGRKEPKTGQLLFV